MWLQKATRAQATATLRNYPVLSKLVLCLLSRPPVFVADVGKDQSHTCLVDAHATILTWSLVTGVWPLIGDRTLRGKLFVCREIGRQICQTHIKIIKQPWI